MRALTGWEHDFITAHDVARLATVDEAGQPYVIPIVYVFVDGRIFTPIDGKPKRTAEVGRLRRVRNIQHNPAVSLVIDDYDPDWSKLAWVQVRGTAALLEDGPIYDAAIARLRAKYPQYQTVPVGNWPVIVIEPTHVSGWRAAGS